MAAVALQSAVDPAGGGPLAILVTLLLATVFYGVTMHLAAVFFVGEVPSQRAAYVAPVPALTSILLMRWGPAVVIPVTLFGDFVAIRLSYGLEYRGTLALTLLHFAFAAAMGIALLNLLGVG